jgi:oxygen-independent coproporphyrinogen-3 oxidase
VAAGLYVHFPFCSGKCPYCHFYSVAWTREGTQAWRRGIEKDAAAASAAIRELRVDTIYIGGGTPSLLAPDDVAAIRGLAADRFAGVIDEFTLEANPAGEGRGRLRGWREAGVTRISIGVQSFDDATLTTLGRTYSAAEAFEFCRSAREAGFDALAVDVMIGVPGETEAAVGRTLDALLSLGPDHVSVYFLENVEGLPFAKVLARRPVDEDAAVDQYERIRLALEAGGLSQYEISNFARPGKECRHNLKYWRYDPYLGLGPSACSHVGLSRWCNAASWEAWAEAVERGGSAREEAVELTPKQAAREALVFGLRLVRGIDVAEIEARTGVAIRSIYAREIDELASQGLLVQAGARLWIPADKLLISNAILSRFI